MYMPFWTVKASSQPCFQALENWPGYFKRLVIFACIHHVFVYAYTESGAVLSAEADENSLSCKMLLLLVRRKFLKPFYAPVKWLFLPEYFCETCSVFRHICVTCVQDKPKDLKFQFLHTPDNPENIFNRQLALFWHTFVIFVIV